MISDEAYRENLSASGLPPPLVDLLAGMIVAAREGAFARTGPALADLIGHEPTPARDALSGPASS